MIVAPPADLPVIFLHRRPGIKSYKIIRIWVRAPSASRRVWTRAACGRRGEGSAGPFISSALCRFPIKLLSLPLQGQTGPKISDPEEDEMTLARLNRSPAQSLTGLLLRRDVDDRNDDGRAGTGKALRAGSPARRARMWCGCRRRRRWSTACSTWPRSRPRTFCSIWVRATAAPSSPPPSAASPPRASNSIPTWWRCRGATRPTAGVTGKADLHPGRHLQERFQQGDRRHFIPADRSQPEAAPHLAEHEAGHARGVELLRHGRVGAG